MGSLNYCSEYCSGMEKGQRQKVLKEKYRSLLKDSHFRNICIDALDKHFHEELELEN